MSYVLSVCGWVGVGGYLPGSAEALHALNNAGNYRVIFEQYLITVTSLTLVVLGSI